MTSRSFTTFLDASAFAKKLAKDMGINVRLTKRDDRYILEGNFLEEPPDSKNRRSNSKDKLCDDCKSPIPEGRLRAVPGTTLCTSCQSKLEKNLKNPPPPKNPMIYSRIAELERTPPRCPKGHEMTIREKNNGLFWGCSLFPDCWHTKFLSPKERLWIEKGSK
jgi:RNA polymerase-binding transcription factor DksA